MIRILITDDEVDIREVVKEYGELNNYIVDEASDGNEAIELCKKYHYDCVIMDVMMPKLDGFSACRKIKEISDTPVIILSARTDEYDKLYGFEIGADDYVVKPFSPKELMARIKVILERNNHRSNEIFKYEGLEVDISGRSVTIDGNKVTLTPKELDLLCYFVKHVNVALSRKRILEEVWNFDFLGDDRTVDTHVKELRHHLGNYRDHIVTVRGMGYKFEI